MPEIKFDTGLVSYDLNGKCEVTFNPTDLSFVERIFNTFDALDKKQEEHDAERKKAADNRAFFDFARRMDADMRAMIDDVFDAPVSEAQFGRMNVYAYASGIPVWCNLMLALMDETNTSFAREQRATNPRIRKYLEKYKKT